MALYIDGVEQGATVGAIFSNDGTKTTIMPTTGDYLRIGDAATTGHSLNSEDDLMVTGEFEVTGLLYADGGLSIGIGGTSILFNVDDGAFTFGLSNDFYFRYETADADARILFLVCDESADSGNNIPVFLFGEATNVDNANLGLFDAIVEPIIAAIDLDADSYAYIGHSGDDVPRVGTNGTGAAGIILTNPKNAAASALSGTQLDVEIDIGGTPYHFTAYPTKA